MDRRSWPWRKKSVDKNGRSQEATDLSLAISPRGSSEQVIAKVPPAEQPLRADEGLPLRQSLEKRMKPPSERLSALLFDVTSKDGLVKQHSKVADGAVSGWEKAEAAALKLQLDAVIQQKEATEDRVSHLDGALKESTRQLRLVREEQEENIHAAIMKKTREWNRVQSELEEQLVDVNAKLLERSAENEAMSKMLEERATNISEISDSLSQARAELNLLQIQLDGIQQENASLRFERTALSKELEIRNKEHVFNKRASEAATNRQLEDGKKIARLDAECQRLRNLVQKKLPSRRVLAQMKLEAAILTKDKGEIVGGKRILKDSKSPKEELKPAHVETCPTGRALDVQTEHPSAMEEETRKLRDLLEKKDSELQYARLMCARSASRLSNSGDQQNAFRLSKMTPLDAHLQAERTGLINSCEPSLASVSDDGHDEEASCAESWASALITELAQFKKEKDDVLACRVAFMEQTKQDDLHHWEDKVELLEKEILEEHEKNMRLETKCRELEEQLLKRAVPLGGSHSRCFHCGAAKGDANGDSKGDSEQASKDKEMAASAEKLAECQRTMLRLSERMKTLNFSEEARKPVLVDACAGERAPLHQEYIQAVADMSSSSSDPLADDDDAEGPEEPPTNSPSWVASSTQARDSVSSSSSSSASSSSSSSKTSFVDNWKAKRTARAADAIAAPDVAPAGSEKQSRSGSFTRMFLSRGKNGQ